MSLSDRSGAAVRRRHAGLSYLQRRRQEMTASARRRCSREQVEQELHGENADLRHWLPHRRQARHDEIGERNVVETDDGKVAWHGEAKIGCGAQPADRLLIGTGEES
jgi:hypothetical protein